jgi:glucokinase
MYYNVKNFNEIFPKEKFSDFTLGIDIGGTNTNLGIAGIRNSKPILLFSLNFKSKEIDSIVPIINTTLKYAKEKHDIKIDYACIGAPGVVSKSNNSAKLTNVPWNISSNEITKKTPLSSVYIINDFQSIGFGINLIDHNNKRDILLVKSGKKDTESTYSTKAIIGAGTGLGKSILNYNKNLNAYIPIPSEGGHADLPIQDNLELQLARFIKKTWKIPKPLTYEEVLSGRGIENIYLFLKKTKKFSNTRYTQEIENTNNKTPLISKYKDKDETCKETFRLFAKFYARCAKNFVLETLASGGLYIAGGIAIKNKDIFSSDEFISEFENAYRRNDFLKAVNINIILNYDISLFGACYAAMYKFLSK